MPTGRASSNGRWYSHGDRWWRRRRNYNGWCNDKRENGKLLEMRFMMNWELGVARPTRLLFLLLSSRQGWYVGWILCQQARPRLLEEHAGRCRNVLQDCIETQHVVLSCKIMRSVIFCQDFNNFTAVLQPIQLTLLVCTYLLQVPLLHTINEERDTWEVQ